MQSIFYKKDLNIFKDSVESANLQRKNKDWTFGGRSLFQTDAHAGRLGLCPAQANDRHLGVELLARSDASLGARHLRRAPAAPPPPSPPAPRPPVPPPPRPLPRPRREYFRLERPIQSASRWTRLATPRLMKAFLAKAILRSAHGCCLDRLQLLLGAQRTRT